MMGTTPPGVDSEKEAARWVRHMFGRVAGRYDLLNHLLSANIDRYWRRRTVGRVRHILDRPGARVLDICCGTGDMLLAMEAARGGAAFGSDFCHPMLRVAQRKGASRLFEADALRLPLRGGSLDLITVAFGLRNFANYHEGLVEMRRVLAPGGLAAILEFSQPPNRLFAGFYRFYSRRVLPLVGGLISGSREAYTYLPDSVRKFPDAPALAQAMRDAGFTQIEYQHLTGGIVALHLGNR